MSIGRWSTGALLAISLQACGEATQLPDMEPGETGRVVRIVDGDTFVLDGGQTVRLVGIEAPRLDWHGDDHEPYAEKSARMLESLILGRSVQLHYPGPTRDRRDRALAHVTTVDGAGAPVWVNLAMADRGGAWVWLYTDTDAEADMLFDAEAHARESARGLWALPDYRPVDADRMEAVPMRRFRLIRGKLGPAEAVASPAEDGRGPDLACQRRIGPGTLLLSVKSEAATACDTPAGQTVEFRTVMETPMLTHPRHLALLGSGDDGS